MFAAPELFAAVTGWAGALSGLIAYGGLTAKRISPDTLRYQGLTLGGAALMGVSATLYGAVPSAVVNGIWVVIGVYGIVSIVGARRAAAARVPVCSAAESSVTVSSAAASSAIVDATDATGVHGATAEPVHAATMAAEAAALADAARTDIALAA